MVLLRVTSNSDLISTTSIYHKELGVSIALMSKYKITQDDLTFIEDDYHDIHTAECIEKLINFLLGLALVYIISLIVFFIL